MNLKRSSQNAILDEFGAPVAENPWPGRLFWPFMAALGFVVFELTADPMLGLVVACLKFGASDATTALWIARHDPIPARGRACMWFLIARGLMKIAVAAIVLCIALFLGVITFGCLNLVNAPIFNDMLKHSEAGFISCLIALIMMIPTPFLGIRAARRSGFKIWIDNRTNIARKRGIWPPPDIPPNRIVGNRILSLIVAGCFMLHIVVLNGFLFAILFIRGKEDTITQVSYGSLFAIGLILLAWLVPRLSKRYAALHPWECWPELRESAASR